MKVPAWIVALVALVQVFCTIVFVSQILLSVLQVPVAPIPWIYHELIEIGAAIGLVLGLILGGLYLRAALLRTRAAEAALRAASGPFMELIAQRFEEWALTPAERDVALFALKGCSLSEIAEIRETSLGTVKAQCNAIYRKAGVSGRPQLLSLFFDDLLDDAHRALTPDQAQEGPIPVAAARGPDAPATVSGR